jgi:hypothetical protein
MASRTSSWTAISRGALTSYTFTNIQASHTITAAFSGSADPPSLTAVAASPATLWPPDHTYRPVTVSYTPNGCQPFSCVLSVTSNEPASGTGGWRPVP